MDSDEEGDDDDDGYGSDASSIDMEEEQRRFDALMDQYLEESFRQYQERHGEADSGRSKKRRRRRMGDDEPGELEGGEDAQVDELPGNQYHSR